MDNSKSLIDRIEAGVVNVAKGVGKCVNYVVNDLGQDTKKLAVYGLAAGVVLTAGAGVAEGETTLAGFKDLIGNEGVSQVVEMNDGDNLMIRDSNGLASVVSKDGVDVWRMGFAKDYGGVIRFGGYANNDNDNSDNYPGYEGWCQGRFYDHVFADGESADDVMIIHDANGDGIGTFDSGVWTLGDDDVPYWTEDIEFNGVQGDINELGPFNYIEMKILPQMTIDAREPRTGPAGMNELEAFGYYWLSNDCSPEENGDCEGADRDYDGDVDFQDFTYMAQGWDPNYILSP